MSIVDENGDCPHIWEKIPQGMMQCKICGVVRLR